MVAEYEKIKYNEHGRKDNTMKKSKTTVFLAIMLIILQVWIPVTTLAELLPAKQELRIGLTSLYSNKETLTIYNTTVGYGYCVNNAYLQEAVLTSASGFTFVPVNGYFVAEEKTYGSYQAAKQAADIYQKQGLDAYPGSSYQCSWSVYFGNAAKYEEAEKLVNTLMDITGKESFKILAGSNYRVKMTGTFGTVLIDVDDHFAYPQLRPLDKNEKGVCVAELGSRSYRGRIEVGRYKKTTLTAVNIVPLEEYLYGVVPSEMPSSWPEEALKAQAVCSRSYALIKAGYGGASNAKKGYKIVDTVSSQVYKGYLAEEEKTNRAVNATKGQMVCYNNKVVAAYFFSISGGRTEASSDVWGADMPYLQSVRDFYGEEAGRMVWQETLTFTQIGKMLAGQGISMDRVNDLQISKVTDTGRAYALNVFGGNRAITLQGTTIRNVLNLNSTKFKIIRQGDIPDQVSVLSASGMTTGRISAMYIASAQGTSKASQEAEQYIIQSADNLWNYPRTAPQRSDELLLAGMGYGHGVGMSQYGAKGMAEAGCNYKDIIEYYFTGAYVR